MRRRATAPSMRRRWASGIRPTCTSHPGIDYLERAYDDAKYGWYSGRPFLTPVAPTLVDDSLAPPGKHVINIFGGHAPYALRGGASWEQEKPQSHARRARGARGDGAGVHGPDHQHRDAGRPGSRGDRRPAAGTHLSRGALGRSALLAASGVALVGLPHARSGRCTNAAPPPTPGAGCRASPGTTPRARCSRTGSASRGVASRRSAPRCGALRCAPAATIGPGTQATD